MSILIKTTMAIFLMSSFAAAADLDGTIADQKEQGLEADTTAMEIKDIETEQKLAREQTRAQEQIAQQTEARLKMIQMQKEQVSGQVTAEIPVLEQRRMLAEKKTAELNKQIKTLSATIKALNDKKAAIEKRAKNAELRGVASQKAVNQLKSREQKLKMELAKK